MSPPARFFAVFAAVGGFLLLSNALLATDASAGEISGVSFDDTAEVGDSALVLNGMALRKKWFVKVYTIGLYLKAESTDANAILKADEPRMARLVLKMDLSGKKFGGSIGDAFEGNKANDMAALADRLTNLKAMFGDSKKGEAIVLSYSPGSGTSVTQSGKALGNIDGKDFADALFGVWIGLGSVDKGMNDGLLGK
jgi:hypothetical protein